MDELEQVANLSIPFIGIFALHLFGLQMGLAVSLTLSIPFIGIFALHLVNTKRTHPINTRLSIPFIGIFALHLASFLPTRPGSAEAFNSLYWDFCFASVIPKNATAQEKAFQFPLLGFLLCIAWILGSVGYRVVSLSIPFIGIFALHRLQLSDDYLNEVLAFQFPLLGFLLCIIETVNSLKYLGLTFNSLYWDFCFASHVVQILFQMPSENFQFPLLGFLLCIWRISWLEATQTA